MTHVAFLLTGSLERPSTGGRYFPLARELVRLGYTVDFIGLHPDFGQQKERAFERDGVGIFYAGQMHVRDRGTGKTYFGTAQLAAVAARATVALARQAVARRPDIIHVGKPHPMNSLAGLWAARRCRAHLYLDCDDYEAGSGRFGAAWQRTVVAWFERQAPRYAERVTTNTLFMQAQLQRWGIVADRIVYLPNGVDRARFAAPDEEALADLRSRLGLAGKKVVAFIGSLGLASHAVDLLLRAFAGVRAVEPAAALLIVGSGEDEGPLRDQAAALGIAADVRFCGRVAPVQVPLYYHLAQVTVDPVYDDPGAAGRAPLKLFESWAAGVAFISADVGDRRRLLGDPPAGILVEPGSAAALTEAILRVFGDPGCAAAVTAAGLARAGDFSWDRLALRLDAAYRARDRR